MLLETVTERKYIGRTSELEALQSIASEAKAGEATSVFLSGKGSVGKTELLKHSFNRLFIKQDLAIPFYYSFHRDALSVEDFSRDYITAFILQSMAFLRKDASMITPGVYSLEDLLWLSRDSGTGWAVDAINDYLKIETDGHIVNMLSYVASLPQRCSLNTEMPVVVFLDDFEIARKLFKISSGDSGNLWLNFERAFNSANTPHIVSGSEAELEKMFFEESSIGEHLEFFELKGLSQNDSATLFNSLCKTYKLNIDPEQLTFIDIFKGNPFYIKSYAQAARRFGSSLSEDDLHKIYLGEITKGKLYLYWTSRLKKYVPRFGLRKSSLNFLNHLSVDNSDTDLSDLCEQFSVDIEDLEHIIDILHQSGTVGSGFSLIELADDRVLADLVRVLYQRELLRESSGKVKDLPAEKRAVVEKPAVGPFFKLTIPADPKSELVVIKSLQQIARHYGFSEDMTGQMQIALVELFVGHLMKDLSLSENYDIEFRLREKIFTAEIVTAQPDFSMAEEDIAYLKSYVDDLKIEKMVRGSKIILTKTV